MEEQHQDQGQGLKPVGIDSQMDLPAGLVHNFSPAGMKHYSQAELDAMSQAITNQCDLIRQQWAVIANAFTTAFGPAIAAVQPVMESVMRTVHEAYLADGAPYGDTSEGMYRWMQDLSEINRHQAEIERIRQRQQTRIDARKLGDRIRVKREARKGAE